MATAGAFRHRPRFPRNGWHYQGLYQGCDNR